MHDRKKKQEIICVEASDKATTWKYRSGNAYFNFEKLQRRGFTFAFHVVVQGAEKFTDAHLWRSCEKLFYLGENERCGWFYYNPVDKIDLALFLEMVMKSSTPGVGLMFLESVLMSARKSRHVFDAFFESMFSKAPGEWTACLLCRILRAIMTTSALDIFSLAGIQFVSKEYPLSSHSIESRAEVLRKAHDFYLKVQDGVVGPMQRLLSILWKLSMLPNKSSVINDAGFQRELRAIFLTEVTDESIILKSSCWPSLNVSFILFKLWHNFHEKIVLSQFPEDQERFNLF